MKTKQMNSNSIKGIRRNTTSHKVTQKKLPKLIILSGNVIEKELKHSKLEKLSD
jgi:hypothetical protein